MQLDKEVFDIGIFGFYGESFELICKISWIR
jgi:hypothetical protein